MGGQLRPGLLSRVAGQSSPKVIIAYHGSPHSFDRFDASKIGTGEGAQAYGHGLYFAGAEDVARTYRDISPAVPSDAVAKAIQEMQQRAVQLELEAGSIRDAMEQAASERGALSPGWGTMRDVPQDVQQSLGPRLKEIGEQLAALRMEQQRARDGLRGHMYEVELGVPEEALLDLDSPLAGEHKAAVLDAAFAAPANKWQSMAIAEAAEASTPAKVPIESLMRAYNVLQPNRYAGRMPSQAAVSRSLLERGIPGSRYLDAGSRSAGQGTRNYVMFPGTEDRIRILRKYGLLAPMALPAASEE